MLREFWEIIRGKELAEDLTAWECKCCLWHHGNAFIALSLLLHCVIIRSSVALVLIAGRVLPLQCFTMHQRHIELSFLNDERQTVLLGDV